MADKHASAMTPAEYSAAIAGMKADERLANEAARQATEQKRLATKYSQQPDREKS